jgi:hypothetical protein
MNYNYRNYKIPSCIECNQRDTSPVSMIGKIISPDKTILKKPMESILLDYCIYPVSIRISKIFDSSTYALKSFDIPE